MIWPLLLVPTTDLLAGTAAPFTLPTVVADCVPVTSPANEPVKPAAVPVVFAALLGISPETSTGNCACGKVPVVKSDADTVTLLLKAWPLTVVDVPTAPRLASAPAAVVAPVPPDAGSNGDPSVSLPAETVPENDALVPVSAPVSVPPERGR